MEDELSPTQKKVESLKALSLLNNVHNLVPPQNQDAGLGYTIAVIEALRSDPIIEQKVKVLMGVIENPITQEIKSVRKPLMNWEGIGKYIILMRSISTDYEFSSLDEDEMPKRIRWLYENNLPEFTLYCEEYELEEHDINTFSSILFSTIDAILHKSKNGRLLSAIARMYNEGTINKLLQGEEQNKQKTGGWLAKLNPMSGHK